MSGDEAESADVRRSSRRRESKRTEQTKSALELLKEARRSGKAHKAEDDSVANVYELVDDDEYNEISKDRRQNDFVVDDDGSGYVDHGADIFDDDVDDYGEKKKQPKKSKENKPKKSAISAFFAAAGVNKAKAKDDNDIKLEDDDGLDDLLAAAGDVEEVETPSRNPFKREAAVDVSPDRIAPKAVKRNRLSAPLGTVPSRITATAAAAAAAGPSSPPAKRPPARLAEVKQEDAMFDDDFGMDVDEIADSGVYRKEEQREPKVEEPSPPMSRPERVVKVQEMKQDEKKKEAAEMVVDDWAEQGDAAPMEPAAAAAAASEGSEWFYRQGKEGSSSSLRVFWMDAYEDDRKHPGVVYLFGRVLVSAGRSASVCIVVKNIRRQIFVLPRQTEDGSAYPMIDVYNEVKSLLMDTHGINEVKCKPVKRKFINDGTVADAAEAVDVMDVQYYEAKASRVPPAHEGKTFTRIYNATTTSLERLLVECRMKGPGWIDVANYVPAASKVSFCAYEFVVDMADDLKGSTERPKNIVYDTATTDPAPPIRLLCLNVVTALNEKKEPEILAISYLLNPSTTIENPTTDKKAFSKKAFITQPPQGVALPFDLQKKLAERGLRDNVQIFPKEKSLIVSFLNSLTREDSDPDCLVGHDIQATIAVIMARCERHDIPVWSQLSRLRRSVSLRKLGHSKAAQWEITAGRLLLDSRTAAMELVHSRNYDLTELCATLLNEQRAEVHPHEVIPRFCGNASSVISLLMWSWSECHRPLCVLARMQALPLFRGITNICGGVMSRTLLGGRAERNEMLLLHAFSAAGLVAPDKYQHTLGGQKREAKGKGVKKERQRESTQEEAEEKEGEKDAVAAAPKGAQYSGGLVLEPKKGLYDTLVLLLDFNSLYPSIIQEYNICFTTIRHDKNGDDLPEAPTGSIAKGILPAQIELLVTQRYEVKKIMANERNAEKKRQYDIRQKALKLTANSMYGCLGFAQSRFYAKPLAALVTSKGREILMQTKTLVERAGYEVIYGDTDSIMVNTGDVDEEKAKKIAKEITKTVNKLRAKLELEHEGTFRRMLLLKKKKYAALTMDGDGKYKKELKGLDIVRRDWSMLAKSIGSDVVDVILNPSLSREELVSQIDERISKLTRDLKEGAVAMDQFSIFKSLTRDPAKYEDVKQQSHAAVARRMNESGQKCYKQGDIVEYAICLDGTTNSATQRAYHKQEIKEREDELKIDVQYYLSQQVHPVVSRLCAPIDELDAVRIAELLGLDGAHYRSKASSSKDSGPVWQENFDSCEGIKIACPECNHLNNIRDMFRGEGMDRRACIEGCEKCDAAFYRHEKAVYNQFNRQLASLVEREQMAGYVCEDVVCAAKMRAFPMRVTRDGLECPKCKNSFMHKEYSSKELFDQQTFFDRLLDVFSAVKAIKDKEQRSTIEFRPGFIKVDDLARNLKSLNESYMSRNKYNIVDLCFVFGPMMSA